MTSAPSATPSSNKAIVDAVANAYTEFLQSLRQIEHQGVLECIEESKAIDATNAQSIRQTIANTNNPQ